ncbi:hypothetical protein F5B19DRAFT_460919 [Rostrohypoxylon terebratum]|nr:hypothetical protein F5B19DRAFT_460919 [Rostrohypoxylon terebratum]
MSSDSSDSSAKHGRLEPAPRPGLAENSNPKNALQGQAQLGAHVYVVMLTFIISFLVAFCWRLIIISSYFTYHYYIFFYRSSLNSSARDANPYTRSLKVTLHSLVLASLVLWCISITPIHLISPTLTNTLTLYASSSTQRTTEILHDAGNTAAVDIIVIQSPSPNLGGSWAYGKSNNSRASWLLDILPTVDGPQNVRVAVINHQPRWDSNFSKMGFRKDASELLESIESIHRVRARRPIVFIAHGLGGLVLKEALLLARACSKDVASMTKGIIFLGVPHKGGEGTVFSSCLSCMTFLPSSSLYLLQLLTMNDPELLDLESKFYDSYVMRYHLDDIQPSIYDIVEKRPTRVGNPVLGLTFNPRHSQLRHGRLLTLDTDFRGLNQSKSHEDPNFQTLFIVLREAYDHALRYSLLLERVSPSPTIPMVDETVPFNNTLLVQDLLTIATLGLPSAEMDMVTAGCFYGIEEFVASWLAKDMNRSGSYFTSRVLKFALYGAFVHVPLRDTLKWLLRICFSGSAGLIPSILQILILNFLIAPFLGVISMGFLAFISGARTFHQVRATIIVGLSPTLKIIWTLLPVVMFYGHKFLHTGVWVVICNLISFFISIYANVTIKKKRLAALH